MRTPRGRPVNLSRLRNNRLRSPGDVAEASALSPITDVPVVPGRSRGLFGRLALNSARRNQAFAEALTMLRAALVLRLSHGELLIVSITGVNDGSGAEPPAAALAQACAVAGDKVVLVEVDFVRPHIILGARNEYGVANLLRDGGDIDAALQTEEQSGLAHLTAGTGGELADYRSTEMDRVLDVLYTRFDVIILALPPVLEQPDAQAVATISDTTAVVAALGRDERSEVRDLVDLMRLSANAPRVVTIASRG